MFVRNSPFSVPAPLEIIANRYKLTAGEIRVVDAVTRISGLDAIAAALGISVPTVRTHLNHVYRKSGAKNQSDLLRLVTGISGTQ